MDKYEAVLALYQALNAIQIARAAGADATAGEVMRKADRSFTRMPAVCSRRAPPRRR